VVSVVENEELTRVGPGTPGGEMLRRYWHPVAVAAELTPEQPTKRLRILGEDLVLYRAEDGSYGLITEQCAHRKASLFYGFVEGANLRCAYHGWVYDLSGQCVETPFEPAESQMKRTVKLRAYPVQRLAGLLFAYLGPQPAPLLPRWDVVARPDGTRHIQVMPVLNCNWLQAQENSLDPVHVFYLHGHTLFKKGLRQRNPYRQIEGFDFEQTEWGIVKRRTYGGDGGEEYKEPGHPAVFPNMLWHSIEGRDGNNPYDGTMPIDMHWRVPIDDTHTQVFWMGFVPSQDGSWTDPYEDEPEWERVETLLNEQGNFHLSTFASQDHMAWETQGPVVDRSTERLGVSDKGIVMWRKMLQEQIDAVREGRDPVATVRDPEKNQVIAFTPDRVFDGTKYVARETPEWKGNPQVIEERWVSSREGRRTAAAPGGVSQR
jgi:5,5'-dehydrodivanillate O-demethylase oxygenase subunit